MITKEEAAARLDGCEYREEGSDELFGEMRAARLVAVFGASDDLTELRGAIDDEGGIEPLSFTQEGLLKSYCEQGADCPYFDRLLEKATAVVPQFDPGGGYTFIYKTDIPHATFEVIEDGEPYCRGIVFALADVPTAPQP